MKYMGSKNRIAKYILPIILANRKDGQMFYDVFCGGGNIIEKVKAPCVAIDNNEFLIEALKLIRDNPYILPRDKNDTNENCYQMMKNSDNKALKGYYGFALSYGGKWFGGWRRDSENKRDYIKEAYKNALKQSDAIKHAVFVCSSYCEHEYVPQSIIYCDPPYKNTTSYKNNFNHDNFWQWVRNMSYSGHQVFVSEYNAPDDFECLWEKEIVSSLTRNTGAKKGVEKLFRLRGIE